MQEELKQRQKQLEDEELRRTDIIPSLHQRTSDRTDQEEIEELKRQ